MKDLIAKLRETRSKEMEALESVLTTASDAGRADLDEAEQTEFETRKASIAALDQRIADLAEMETRAAAAAAAVPVGDTATTRVQVGSEEPVYRRDSRTSYFRDLASAARSDRQAQERLERHQTQALDTIAREDRYAGYRETRDISRTDTAGGEFVPPLWLIDDYEKKLRAGRVTANLCRNENLPGGTDSINIPRVTTGTLTATQADNAAVSEQDLVTASVAANVTTIAGMEDASMQLVEQSPLAGGLDSLIFGDLTMDYNKQVDSQVINGSGTTPQMRGILNTTGVGAVAYTDASPTQSEVYAPTAQALSAIAQAVFAGAEFLVMHPRRWYWLLSALDASNRPFIVPEAQGVYMAQGVAEVAAGEGRAGVYVSVPTYIDANVPTNLGTNEDAIIAGKRDAAILWEGALRTRVLLEVLSGTLTARFQLYRYTAFTAGRYAGSFAKITGTGLIAPAGF